MEKCEILEHDSKNEIPIRENRELQKEEGKYFYCVMLCNEKKSFGKIGINNHSLQKCRSSSKRFPNERLRTNRRQYPEP
jgi:hypothetical protein